MGDVFTTDPDDLINNAIALQQSTGISLSATFNNIQVRPDQANLDIFIENFKPIYEAGIRSATIPHTTWVLTGQIQKEFPELEIKNTILRGINTAADVAKQAEAGFHYINIDRDLMRNKDELKKIRKAADSYNIKIALLSNESCLGSCPIMDEHYHFNNTRDSGPQYFTDTISRVSCSAWDITDPVSALKTSNITPWREDWVELLEYVDVFKMHGRESLDQMSSTMSIIHNYINGEEILFDDFNEYLDDTNLKGKPINAWRQFIKNCKFDCWDCNKCDKLYEATNGVRVKDKRDIIIETLCTTYLD
jgi:sugar phosphate isomerase/epimerase